MHIFLRACVKSASISLNSPSEIYILRTQPPHNAASYLRQDNFLASFLYSLKSLSLLTGHQILWVISTTRHFLQVIRSHLHYLKQCISLFLACLLGRRGPGLIYSRTKRMWTRHMVKKLWSVLGTTQNKHCLQFLFFKSVTEWYMGATRPAAIILTAPKINFRLFQSIQNPSAIRF